jgi:hypothetical protein
MKYALFLLALILGSVSGIHLEDATVTGSTEVVNGAYVLDGTNEATCSDCLMNNLYKRCVEDPAVARGFAVQRRELRGNRRLCPSYCPAQRFRGQWCWYKCDTRRRLKFADEDSERSLVVVDELQQAALVCYQEKAEDPLFACLGVASGISVALHYA